MKKKQQFIKHLKNQVKKRFTLRHLAKVGSAIVLAVAALPSSATASDVDTASQVTGTDAGKTALNEALKFSKTKPALSIATGIVCLACISTATAATSPALCIAGGILIAKTFG